MTYLVHDAKLGVREGTRVGDVVDVEARVRVEGTLVSPVKHVTRVVAGGVAVRVGQDGPGPLGREGGVLVEVARVVAVLVGPAQGVHVGLVEVEDVLPGLDEGVDYGLLLQGAVADDGVVDGDAAELVVLVVLGGDEGVGDVGHVVAGVGLAGDVGRGALEAERVDEVAPEADELEAELDFVGDVGRALAVADADGLFDPDHVGPGVAGQLNERM